MTPDEIQLKFQERGLKITPQRGQLLCTRRDWSPSYRGRPVRTGQANPSDDLHEYGVLPLGAFREAGLLGEVNYWHVQSRFDANVIMHHHLVCLGCGRIQNFADDALDQLAVSIQVRPRFEVAGHQVEFYGYCHRCRRLKRVAEPRRKE